MGVLVLVYKDKTTGERVTDNMIGLGRGEAAGVVACITPPDFANAEAGQSAQQIVRNAKRVLTSREGLNGETIDNDTATAIRNVLNYTQGEVRIAKAQRIDPNVLSLSFFGTSQ